MNSFDIRKKFLDYFKKNGHTVVPSSSLIPTDDPTLLFTNAGMNQFKDYFLGKKKPPYLRATSIQKCVRAGGKHNDLENVGFTNRHLTFFEMMGNFSFGDYFKEGAIDFAWEFLTKDVKIPTEKLHATVYKTDDEAYELWHKKIGIPKERIHKLGEKDNFWQMGDTGPCGPCSEIHLDNGPEVGCKSSKCDPSCDCGRFVEIWNLVFMQYDRQEDGKLNPLERTGVDTGMGFERLYMILQGKSSVYETDIFEKLIKEIEKLSGIKYKESKKDIQAAFHVLCDHVRSTSLIIADGGTPSNEGRGYVLRKIIRRAALFAQKLSYNQDLFPDLAKEFIKFFSGVYPELKTNKKLIIKLLSSEITKFSENLIKGQVILEKYIAQNAKDSKNFLTGEQVFKLYDTYGFPTEITKVIADEKGLSLDMVNFEKEMEKQKEQSGQKKTIEEDISFEIPKNIETKFIGYDKLESKSKISFCEKDDSNFWIITKESPFYVESGGQVSDKGWVSINDQSYPVLDLKKENKAILVKISTKDIEPKNIKIKVGDSAHCVVDFYSRRNTEKNHTATHLLQTALRQILGESVKQAGSLVNSKQLRFDFSQLEALTYEQIQQVEALVNQKIQEDLEVKTFTTTLAEAKDASVISFFGEKYDPVKVRVVEVGDFSAELCGGNHVSRTGKIGCFKISSLTALASGVRRIFGVTGPEAVKLFQQSFSITKNLCEMFKEKIEGVLEATEKLQKNYLDALSTIKKMKKELWKSSIPTWQEQIKEVGKAPFLFLELEDFKSNELKQVCTELEKKTPGFYFLTSTSKEAPENINFLGYLSKKFSKTVDLKTLASLLREKFDLRGGGSNMLIQGGGATNPEIKKTILEWLKPI